MEQILSTTSAGSIPPLATLPQEPSQTQQATSGGLNGIPTTSTVSDHPNAPPSASVSSLSCLPYFIQSIVSWVVWIFTCGLWNLSSDSIDNSEQDDPLLSSNTSSRQPQETTAPIENTSLIETPSSQPVINKNSGLLNLIGFFKTFSDEQNEKVETFILGPRYILCEDYTLSRDIRFLIDQLKQNPLKDISAFATEFNITLSAFMLGLALLQLLDDREPKVINNQIFTELSSLSLDLAIPATDTQINAVKSIIQKMDQEDHELLKEVVVLFSSFPKNKWADILSPNLPMLIQRSFNESKLSEEQRKTIVNALTIMMMHSNEVFTS
jgi:hypothetical protein